MKTAHGKLRKHIFSRVLWSKLHFALFSYLTMHIQPMVLPCCCTLKFLNQRNNGDRRLLWLGVRWHMAALCVLGNIVLVKRPSQGHTEWCNL